MRPAWGRAVRLVFAAVVLLAPVRAAAHSFEPAILDLRERAPGVFDVVWRAPCDEAGARDAGRGGFHPGLPGSCRVVTTDGAGPAGDDETTFFRVTCGPGRLHGERITIHGIAGSRVDAMVRVTWNDGRTATGVLRTDVEDFEVPPAPGVVAPGASARTVAWRYLRLGVHHILAGFDHLLFVTGLFLLVGATRALLVTITAFTLAHSLTLVLAVLGVVRVPSAPVEALIALSIVVLARELVRSPDEPTTLTRRVPWVVAFAFGLLHGLGFAGALAETGVPPDQIPLALVAFNVGVELGQLAVVGALVAGALALRGVLPRARWVRAVPAYAIGGLAAAWTLERVLGLLV